MIRGEEFVVTWLLLAAILTPPVHGITASFSKTDLGTKADEAVLSVRYDSISATLEAYTNENDYTLKVAGDGSVSTSETKAHPRQQTIMGRDHVGNSEVTVSYYKRCVTYKSAGVNKSIGQCIGEANEDLSSEVVSPYAALLSPDGLKVIFTDIEAGKVRSWNVAADTLSTLSVVRRPKAIVYDDKESTYYITAEHGVFSTRDGKFITGDNSKLHGGFKDGSLDEAEFSYPHGLALIRSGVFVVTDTANNRVRLVDLKANSVTTLSDGITGPMSVAYNPETTSVYVGGADGLFMSNVPEFKPVNLCYNLKASGESEITLEGKKMKVWCDLDSPDGPWITFLKRFDGSTDFSRTFAEYKAGFGDVNGEYWLGLENLHFLTKNKQASLRMDMKSSRAPRGKEATAYASYSTFWVGDEASDYTLQEITGYSGTAGDMETVGTMNIGGPHKGQKFTTKDNDFDDLPNGNCAGSYNGGWWFRQCFTACLTCGPWNKRPRPGIPQAMIYFPYTEFKIGLLEADMKVKLPESMIYEN